MRKIGHNSNGQLRQGFTKLRQGGSITGGRRKSIPQQSRSSSKGAIGNHALSPSRKDAKRRFAAGVMVIRGRSRQTKYVLHCRRLNTFDCRKDCVENSEEPPLLKGCNVQRCIEWITVIHIVGTCTNSDSSSFQGFQVFAITHTTPHAKTEQQ